MHLLSLFFLLTSFFVPTSVTNKNINEYYAKSYIVMDFYSGKILEEKNKDLIRSVASISKLMTAYVTLNYASDLNQKVLIGKEIENAYGSAVYLNEGEELSLLELLYALLLRSGNDAAFSIASYIGDGDISLFVAMMNNEAKKIGMKNSLFRNPCGLDEKDGGNLSSAYEMALLMRECMKNEIFASIVNSSSYRSTNHGEWKNKNKLLSLYEYTTGGKTGYTRLAKRTLVTSAKKVHTHLIIVTLDCGNDFLFHKTFYEKYFNLYENRLLIKQGNFIIDKYHIYVKQDLNYILKKDEWQSTLLIYKINHDKTELDIYLLIDNEEYYLETCEIKEIEQGNIKISFWKKIINFFRRLFR